MCVTRAAADLPLFHGVSRKKLLAWPATQIQSGGGIVGTDNQQAVDGENQRARWPAYALYRLPDLAEGVWGRIQSGLDRTSLSVIKTCVSVGFRASRTRVELATCGV
jgi:hypothetical protein